MQGFEEENFSKKIDFKTWKEIYSYTKRVRKPLLVIIFTMIMLAIGDTVFPLFSKYAIDNYVVDNKLFELVTITVPVVNFTFTIQNIYLFTIIFSLVIIIQVIGLFVFIKCAGIVEGGIQHDIREAAYLRLQELSFSYYDRTPSGWIIARLISDSKRIGAVVAWVIIDFVWGIGVIIAMLVSMFILNEKLALLIIVMMPVIAVLGFYFQTKILNGHREVSKMHSNATASYSEGIAGAKTIKTLVNEHGSFEEFDKITRELRDKSIKVQIYSSVFVAVVLFIGTIGTAIVLNYGGNLVLENSIEVGTLAVFLSYVTLVFEPISHIAKVFAELQAAQASSERVISLVNQKLELQDKPEVIEKYGDFFNPKIENYEEFKGEIEFKNVTFKYKDGDKVLENFNLKVNAGEKIALVGETGGGKSTIINLISRFYEPTDGEILLDGLDYGKRSQGWLHSKLSYVLQSPHLFTLS